MSNSRPSSGRKRSDSNSSLRGVGKKDPDDFITECKAGFLTVVPDLKGKISSPGDLQLALQNSGRSPSKKAVKKYYDSNLDITLEVFCDLCKQEKTTSHDELMKAFKRIDINGDGFISHSELRKTMTTRGEKMSDSEVSQMITDFDENNDGKLDYKEFIKMVSDSANKSKEAAIKRMEKKLKREREDKSHTVPLSPRISPRLSTREMNGTREKRNSVSGSQTSLRSERSHRTTPDSPRSSSRSANKISKPPTPRLASPESDDNDVVVSAAPRSTYAPSKKRKSSGASPKPPPRQQRTINGSDTSSPKPAPRRSSHQDKPAVSSLHLSLNTPRDLKRWKSSVKRRGMFYAEPSGNIMTTQYTLTISKSTNVWLTIEPSVYDSTYSNCVLDVSLYVTRTKLDQNGNVLVSCTEHRNHDGKHGVQLDLDPGTYNILPHTSGCRLPFESKKSQKKELVKKTGSEWILTSQLKSVLRDIFAMIDQDLDGALSRTEFENYCSRTGEDIGDDEWDTVKEHIGLVDGKITEDGFLHLIQLELEDAEGDTEDLSVTLESMGYNQSLIQTHASPFIVEFYAQDDSKMKVNSESALLHPKNKFIRAAQQEAIKSKTEVTFSCGDVDVYCYESDTQAAVLLNNKSAQRSAVKLDLSACKNVKISGLKTAGILTIPVNGDQSVIACYVLPHDEARAWNFSCSDARG